jgi:NADH-quinone oxidoreductase subunit A
VTSRLPTGECSLSEFTAVVVFLIVGVGIVLFTFLLAKIIRPSSPGQIKLETYECGEQPFGTAEIQYNVRFYIYALLFVVFDVEAIFLFPWALVYRSLGLFAFVEMFIFIAILVFGLFYAWRKGVLKWF